VSPCSLMMVMWGYCGATTQSTCLPTTCVRPRLDFHGGVVPTPETRQECCRFITRDQIEAIMEPLLAMWVTQPAPVEGCLPDRFTSWRSQSLWEAVQLPESCSKASSTRAAGIRMQPITRAQSPPTNRRSLPSFHGGKTANDSVTSLTARTQHSPP
jgi:hypothetical protein